MTDSIPVLLLFTGLCTHVPLADVDMLFDAHRIQLKLPMNRPAVPIETEGFVELVLKVFPVTIQNDVLSTLMELMSRAETTERELAELTLHEMMYIELLPERFTLRNVKAAYKG